MVFLRLVCRGLVLVLLVACGGGGGGSSATPAPAPPSAPAPTPTPVSDAVGVQAPISTNAGHPTFMSPHSKPIVINGRFVYAANTADDTVDVIDSVTRQIVVRINVGIDPVGLAVRPDGMEVWVANHVSDTVSVIDTDPANPTLHHVIATVQAIDTFGFSTLFDEPVGIAFASNQKAYVALGPDNEIAIVDAGTYAVTGRLPIRAQDPRAITVRGDRLYVVAFESNNRTQLSGCRPENIDGDICTFDAVEHVFSNNNVLSLNYDADIIKNPLLPDRDLFVFNTANDQLVETVETVGTLLYGLAVDSNGRVFVSQADALNDENGRAGTLKEGLTEMENRAFLNQITRIDCASGCAGPEFFELEPLPPVHPDTGMALATPFGIQVTEDDSTLVVTLAGSNKLVTLDPDTGDVLDRVDVGAIPRGIALEPDADGLPSVAWVLNVGDNTVSVVDISSPQNIQVDDTIALSDPTHPDVKQGRLAFNDADASTTGTFSCESCHPDGLTDQLIWVLDTPICDVAGCTQIAPRLTMPIRGLRDTAPYHWDGIPGDPFGGINTSSINSDVAPKCDINDPASCTLDLVDGTLASTMCDLNNCPLNDEGKLGALDQAERAAMSKFLLSVPHPPAKTRSFDNVLSNAARDGFFEFSFTNDAAGRATGAQTCGDCHKMPFLVSTNTPGTGMDAPTWRGAYDRWMILPQGRLNIIDLMNIVGMDDTFPERDVWILAGASPDIWEMVVQGSTGFSGSFARQVTLNVDTTGLAQTTDILDALEVSAAEGAVLLQAEGVQIAAGVATPIGLEFANGAYEVRGDTLAAMLITIEHYPNTGTKQVLQSIIDSATATANEKIIATAIMNLEHQATAEDKDKLQAIIDDTTATAAETTLATIVHAFNHYPSASDKVKLQLIDDNGTARFSRAELMSAATAGELVVTLTGRLGQNVDLDNPQPALWPVAPIQAQTRNVQLAFLDAASTLRFNARHVQNNPSLFVDGRKVDGTVICESGALPSCDNEIVLVQFVSQPAGGLHFLQVQNAQGLFSNDMMFFSDQSPLAPRLGNLITSGGAFTAGQFDNNWNTVELVTDAIFEQNGEVHIDINSASVDPWRAQISHAVMVVSGQEYTLCYSARATAARVMTGYLDSNMDQYSNISGGQFQENLTTSFQPFSHTFTVAATDLRARVAFDFAQSDLSVQIDNIGLYEGTSCGSP